jgi:hypothetical protein
MSRASNAHPCRARTLDTSEGAQTINDTIRQHHWIMTRWRLIAGVTRDKRHSVYEYPL